MASSCPSCGGYTSRLERSGAMAPETFPQANRVVVHVDSRARNLATQPSSSQFVVDLPEKLHNVSAAALLSAEIPLSFYAFSAVRGNTQLTATLDGTPGVASIPEGNYTQASMATALAAALGVAFAGTTFTVAFNPATSRCSITASAGVLAVDATASDGTDLATLLGFARGVVTGGTSATATGAGAATMSPDAYLLISVDQLDAAGLATTWGMAGDRSFAKIPLKNDSFLANPYDVGSPRLLALRPPLSRLDRLRVSLRFGDGTPVDLNGGEWSMTLELVGTLARPT